MSRTQTIFKHEEGKNMCRFSKKKNS